MPQPKPRSQPASKASRKPSKRAARPASPRSNPAPASTGREKRRFWLTYPSRLITRPIIWEMTQRFAIVFNVRQASVTEEIGILCLELEGPRPDLKAAIAWLERRGVQVEPVEINVIES